jgi:hypothetical protein
MKIYFTSIIIEISKRDRGKIFNRSEKRKKTLLYIDDSGKIRTISEFSVSISKISKKQESKHAARPDFI